MDKTKILAIVFFVVLGLIGLIVVFSIIGSLSPTITDSANSISFPNNCSDGKDANNKVLTFNVTDKQCYNQSASGNVTALYTAALYQLPLSGLFTPTGVVVIILMAVLFLALILFLFRMLRKK